MTYIRRQAALAHDRRKRDHTILIVAAMVIVAATAITMAALDRRFDSPVPTPHGIHYHVPGDRWV